MKNQTLLISIFVLLTINLIDAKNNNKFININNSKIVINIKDKQYYIGNIDIKQKIELKKNNYDLSDTNYIDFYIFNENGIYISGDYFTDSLKLKMQDVNNNKYYEIINKEDLLKHLDTNNKAKAESIEICVKDGVKILNLQKELYIKNALILSKKPNTYKKHCTKYDIIVPSENKDDILKELESKNILLK